MNVVLKLFLFVQFCYFPFTMLHRFNLVMYYSHYDGTPGDWVVSMKC